MINQRDATSLLEETKLLLQRHRSFPKKILSQNFMIEPFIFQRMVDYASLNAGDTVLDVGAGLGFLTLFVARKCNTVMAVEIDTKLAEILREQTVGVPNVKVIEGDVLKAEVPYFNKIVSIPPYNISSKLLLWLFKKDFDCAVLVFQKEFVNRLVAPIGSEDYGWLTVVTYYHAEVELLESVPKRMFFPQPKIDSVITCLKPKQPRPFTIRDNASFEKFVRLLFTQRNKKIRNAVLPYVKSIRAVSKQDATEIADSLPFCDKRVRELAPEDFGALANDLSR